MVRRRPTLFVWAILLVLALTWGSSFILMKRGLFHAGEPVLSPWQMASARLFMAWLALSPLLVRHGGLFRRNWLPLLGTGLLGNGLPAILFAFAQTRIDSSLSGMLNSLTPLMTLVVGVLLFGQRLRAVHVLGVGIGLTGALLLVRMKSGDGTAEWTWYAMAPIVGTLCYGLSGNIVKAHLSHLPAAGVAALALTWVGPVSLGLALATGLPDTLAVHPHGWRALGHVAVLAVGGSAFALVLWNMLLQRTTAVQASMVTYLMPVVAIGWGMLDGERITPGQLLMVAVVLAAVYIVSRGGRNG
jgi:drug/metabolite transporter (DMT)-like permease